MQLCEPRLLRQDDHILTHLACNERCVVCADASEVAGLNPDHLAALQFAERVNSASLSLQLHAAANDRAKVAAAADALQQLLRHPKPASPATTNGGIPAGSSGGSLAKPAAEGSRDNATTTVHLLLVAAMAAGIDARSAPLRLRTAVMPGAVGEEDTAGGGGDGSGGADVAWVRHQQRLYFDVVARESATAGRGRANRLLGVLKLFANIHSGSGSSSSSSSSYGSNSSSKGSRDEDSLISRRGPAHEAWHRRQRMAPLYRWVHPPLSRHGACAS